jgi:hypothetical protein
MSLNIAPVYAKQYIRYAETWEAAADKETAGVGLVEIGEFRAVQYATYAGAGKVAAGDAFDAQPDTIVGVNQAFIPTALSQPHTARQASVASSGMLLIEVDPTAGTIALNSALEIDLVGRATDDGVAVTCNGATPLIREVVEIGGRKIAVVNFA